MMPIIPLIAVNSRPSRKNCIRMLRLVAPSALRRPISRVRSVTVTSMMLMMPTAPRASVTIPTPPRNTSIAVKITPTVRCDLIVSHSSNASVRLGSNPCLRADDLVYLGLCGLILVRESVAGTGSSRSNPEECCRLSWRTAPSSSTGECRSSGCRHRCCRDRSSRRRRLPGSGSRSA